MDQALRGFLAVPFTENSALQVAPAAPGSRAKCSQKGCWALNAELLSRRCRVLWMAALVLWIVGCSHLAPRDPIQAYVVGIEPLQGERLELRMLVKLRVQNPNETPIHYDGVHVDLKVQGRSFASGVSNERGVVPRFGEQVVNVPVSISALRLFQSAVGVLDQSRGKIEYELRGKLAGPAFRAVRFDARGEMVLPTELGVDGRSRETGD